MDRSSITRREVLSIIGGGGIVGLAGCTSNSNSENNGGGGTNGGSGGSKTVKIGVLQPTSGELKYYGQQSLWGFYEGFNHKSDSEFTAEAKTGKKTVTVGDVTDRKSVV